MSRRDLAVCLVGGVLTAFSVAPFGWWVLGPVGLAVLFTRLAGRPARARAANGVAFALGLYGIGLAWVLEFSVPGTVIFVLLMALLTGLPMAFVPPGAGRWLGFPATVVVVELVRSRWPVGGLPLSGIDLGQAGGPLAPVVAVGGRYLLVGTVATAAVGLVALTRRPRRGDVAAAAMVIVATAAGAGWTVPRGHAVGHLRVATVQGGGQRGIPALQADERQVFRAHLDASNRVRRPVDLVLWPEDVVDVVRFAGSEEEAELRALARSLRATLVVGVVEDAGCCGFRNFALAIGPDGRTVARYDKKHRVPYGEYFPLRSLIERVATIPDRDAVAGRGVGLLATPAGRLAVAISYEVFFQGRARDAVNKGGQVLLVPTNASSYTTGQMPAQELAAARLRAWQTGRAVLQAAPTGFTALVDPRGRVRAHTDLGARQVLQGRVERRRGSTPYDRVGDGPVAGVVVVAAGAAWVLERSRIKFPR